MLGASPYVETPLFDCQEAEGLSVNSLVDLVGGALLRGWQRRRS